MRSKWWKGGGGHVGVGVDAKGAGSGEKKREVTAETGRLQRRNPSLLVNGRT